MADEPNLRRASSGAPNLQSGGDRWFWPAVIAVIVVGAIAVGVLAVNRESNIGVAPEAQSLSGNSGGDHWHIAYGFANCGTLMPFATDDRDPKGIHTHGDGLIHIHPFNTSVSGNNATMEAFLEATQGELTDESYTPGPSEFGAVPINEADGCDGEEAELRLAYWENLTDDAPTTVITENFTDFKFPGDLGALTVALMPVDAPDSEIPRPLQAQSVSPLDAGDELAPELNPDAVTGTDDTEATDTDATDADAEAESDVEE